MQENNIVYLASSYSSYISYHIHDVLPICESIVLKCCKFKEWSGMKWNDLIRCSELLIPHVFYKNEYYTSDNDKETVSKH